jgi:uncharacterized membrane protein
MRRRAAARARWAMARVLHCQAMATPTREDALNMNVERTSVEGERTWVFVAYALHLVGAIAGLTSLIGLVINYLKRGSYDDLFDNHHRWMTRSFWWALLWVCIGWVTTIILVGWAILFLVWLWYIYRHVRGLVNFINGEPMPR